MSVSEQLVSATEQLRKCSGAVRKCSGAVSKSSGTVISVPWQLEVFRNSYKSSGAVSKVFRISYESAPE